MRDWRAHALSSWKSVTDSYSYLDPAAVDKPELAVSHQALDQRLRALGLLRPPAREECLCMQAQPGKLQCAPHKSDGAPHKCEDMQIIMACCTVGAHEHQAYEYAAERLWCSSNDVVAALKEGPRHLCIHKRAIGVGCERRDHRV